MISLTLLCAFMRLFLTVWPSSPCSRIDWPWMLVENADSLASAELKFLALTPGTLYFNKHLRGFLGAWEFENHCFLTWDHLTKYRNKPSCSVELFFLWDDLLQKLMSFLVYTVQILGLLSPCWSPDHPVTEGRAHVCVITLGTQTCAHTDICWWLVSQPTYCLSQLSPAN